MISKKWLIAAAACALPLAGCSEGNAHDITESDEIADYVSDAISDDATIQDMQSEIDTLRHTVDDLESRLSSVEGDAHYHP